jgi:hypothetical protein
MKSMPIFFFFFRRKLAARRIHGVVGISGFGKIGKRALATV